MTASRSRERLVREDAETDVKRRAQEEGGGACLEEDARDDLKRRARRGRRECSRKTSAISARSAFETDRGVLCSLRALPSRGRLSRRTPRQSQTPSAPRPPRSFQENLGDLRELGVETVRGVLCSLRALPSRGRLSRRDAETISNAERAEATEILPGRPRRSPRAPR